MQCRHISVGKYILCLHHPYVLHIGGIPAHISRQAIAGVYKRWLYGIPVHTCPVVAILQIIFQRRLGEKCLPQVIYRAIGCRSKRPRNGRKLKIIGAAGPFKVIDVYSAFGVQGIYLLGMAGQQRCYFQVTVQKRGRCGGIYRQLIQRTGQCRHLGLVVGIHTQHSVLDRVFAIRHLLREGPLIQPHHGTAQRQVFVHIIIKAGSHEVLLLKTKGGIVLVLDIDRHTRVEYTSVDDLQFAQAIVHGIVLVLHQLGATGRYCYRTRWYIEATQKYIRRRGRFIAAPHDVPVILLRLLRHGFGRVVKYLVDVFLL